MKLIKHMIVMLSIVISSVSMTACEIDDSESSSSESSVVVTTTKKEESRTSVDDATKSEYSDGSSEKSYSDSSNTKKESKEEYYCMGKGDTCKNKTSDPSDLYCYSCDPDGNNIEGDQRGSKSDGHVGDNDYDGDIDTDDWEDEWNNFLNDKLDNYGYEW